MTSGSALTSVGAVLNSLTVRNGGKAPKRSGNGWEAHCPAHDDRKASLSIAHDGSKTLLTCHADCTAEAIVTALGMTLADLFDKERPATPPLPLPRQRTAKANTTTYDLLSADGALVAQHIRTELADGSKSFSWRRDGRASLGGLKVENIPLYGLLELLAQPRGAQVIVTEGEKACDALRKAGYLAVATVSGASGTPSLDVLRPLFGYAVCLWPDNDLVGRKHMARIGALLAAANYAPMILQWPDAPEHGDAFDYLALGGDVEDLLGGMEVWENPDEAQVEANEQAEHSFTHIGPDGFLSFERRLATGNLIKLQAKNFRADRAGGHAFVFIHLDDTMIAYDDIALMKYEEHTRLTNAAHGLFGMVVAAAYPKTWLHRDLDLFCLEVSTAAENGIDAEELEGAESLEEFRLAPYLLEEAGMVTYAPPGRGKSFLGLLMGISIDAGCNILWAVQQAKVLFVNLERSKNSIQSRLLRVNRALGLAVNRKMLVLNARGKSLADVIGAIQRLITRHGVRVLILDSLSRSGLGDLNDNRTGNAIVDALNSFGIAWIAIGHTPRQDETHLYGSQMFDGGADVMLQVLTELHRDPDGRHSTIGLGLQVTKANDIPIPDLQLLALEFDQTGLCGVRVPRRSEFPEVVAGRKMSRLEQIVEFVLDEGMASAQQVAKALNMDRTNVAKVFANSDQFVSIKRVGKELMYGIRAPQTSV